MMAKIETPCTKVCIVEHHSGLCLGCARTLNEVANWSAYTDAERSRIMAELPRRLETMHQRTANTAAS